MNDLLKQAQDRLKLFKKYGYDIPKARSFIISQAKLSKGKILEVGTGSGHMAMALAKKHFQLISIDIDKKAQTLAKNKLKTEHLNRLVTLKRMNAEKLQFKDRSFDYVISVNFIHHAKDPETCLREMARVSKGRLIIADLNKRGERIMDKIHGLEGHKHQQTKMPLKQVKIFLRSLGLSVKLYYDKCQTVIITKQGEIK